MRSGLQVIPAVEFHRHVKCRTRVGAFHCRIEQARHEHRQLAVQTERALLTSFVY